MAEPMREQIGAVVAYDTPWDRLGVSRVVRCGGTVEVRASDGKDYKITVEEVP